MEVSGQQGSDPFVPRKYFWFSLIRRMDGPQSHSGRFGELNLLTIPGFDPRIYQAVAQSLYHFSIPNLSVNYFNIFRYFDALCVLNSFLQFIDVIGLWGGAWRWTPTLY